MGRIGIDLGTTNTVAARRACAVGWNPWANPERITGQVVEINGGAIP